VGIQNPNIVEESTTSEMEKEAGHGGRAGNMGAPATPQITAPLSVRERERKMIDDIMTKALLKVKNYFCMNALGITLV
jgi:hypothetical protein